MNDSTAIGACALALRTFFCLSAAARSRNIAFGLV